MNLIFVQLVVSYPKTVLTLKYFFLKNDDNFLQCIFSLLAQRLMMLVAWCPFFCFHASHSPNIQNYLSPWESLSKEEAKYVSDTAGDITKLVWYINHLLIFICQKITICHLKNENTKPAQDLQLRSTAWQTCAPSWLSHSD